MSIFGSNPTPKTDPRATNPQMLGPEAGTCVISVGTNLEGKFNSKENVRLDGKIVGEVFCESRLVMGDTGVVHGSIHAAEAVIMGKIEGDIHIRGSLTLKNTARIKGNISAKLMAVEEGAQYNGECKIGAEPSGK